MGDFYNTIKSFQGGLEEKPYTLIGDLGIIRSGQVLVNVPNRPPFVYVRLRSALSEIIQAYNDRIVPAYGIPVELTFKDGKYVVLGRDSGRYNQWIENDPFLPIHGRTHSFDKDGDAKGKDPVWVYPYQIIPGLVSPLGKGIRNVYIHPFVYDTGEGFITIGGTGTVPLNTYAPQSGTALALIYADVSTGNPGILLSTGTYIDASVTGTHQLIPYLPEVNNQDHLPLGFVRLVSNTSSIGWDNVYDLRQPYSTKYPKNILDGEFVRKFVKYTSPTVNDDLSLGYLVTDEWFDTSTGIVYKCTSNSIGEAIWDEEVSAGGNGDFILRTDGVLAAVNDINAFVVTRDTSITKWYIASDYLGITGSTVLDVKYSGTTIFADPSDRPTLQYNDVNSWASSAAPAKVDFVEGDILTFDLTEVATDAEGLTIVGQNSGKTLRFNLTVEEEDGTPSVSNVGKIVVPDGSLSNNGGGEVSIIHTPYICIQDQKAQGTSGGTFTSGAWRTRDLNTEVSDVGGFASVSSNQITLAAGTYIFDISAPAYKCNRHQAKLYNVSDASDVAFGSSEYTGSADNTGNRSVIRGKFTIAASKILEVRHQCQTTANTYGLGVEANFGTEIYTIAEFWKVG